ncbi:MAG: 5,6-dimethylbenzimidazole synthase [Desulfocapsa sp.]|uniref:5,6-dimethylbenzimidazole synthase n=1 Tax=Desulfotalea psychrophila TaxID=84980 RepID=A0ABS3ATM0_9BACT|nr:5,6-dimethylbenzimidazole synthase [Desulfocapsa sp.]MBN4068443.1 5,6-dimethylbenzimidazole synthase [Desulfotalea psychrophila]
MNENHAFPTEQKEGVYQAIMQRRDIRSQFVDKPVSEEILDKLLRAAHHAPSVGFMQPWNFLVIKDPDTKEQVHKGFLQAHNESAEMFDDKKKKQYEGFKLEGIRESPVNLLITCNRTRTGPVVIGRTVQPEMDLYSTVCAVQNLWLAARAEGIGVGWVSIIHEVVLRKIFKLPESVVVIAYLCIGHVSHFPEMPELEKAGWLPRLNLDELVFYEEWGKTEK